jgi:hypothetical protein
MLNELRGGSEVFHGGRFGNEQANITPGEVEGTVAVRAVYLIPEDLGEGAVSLQAGFSSR